MSQSSNIKLLSFGSNSLGQLSLSHGDDVSDPTEVSYASSIKAGDTDTATAEPLRPIKIVAGGNHTFLVAEGEDGKAILSVGDNSKGQCGLDLGSSRPEPGRVFQPVLPLLKSVKWVNVSAGWQFSIFIGSDDRVYSCGAGPRGELGLGEAIENAAAPTRIPNFPPPKTTVEQLSSSVSHTVALLSDGRVFGWGNGRKGQLLPSRDSSVWAPVEIPVPRSFKVGAVACGRLFTVLISHEGETMVLGDDKWGVRTRKPKQLLTGWKSLAASWGSVYVLMGDGSLVAWGRNTHGQLPQKDLPALETLAVGSEHALGVEAGGLGRLFAWGWGEHGNCGAVHQQGEVVRDVNEIVIGGRDSKRARIVGIGAGCATSWVWIDNDR